ncbi:long-chain fatty acid transport protein 2-like [Salminus brasiliensis]|uniref:long-chain fatty acid transport protein 2-like n=1 Tax=Salminus brasiliensis TaxID=930266 RepID=UPI003B8300ED
MVEVFYSVVLGAAFILAFCFFKFPYFLRDCRYIMKMLVVRSRRTKFRERTPFYTILDCFLDAVQKQPHKPFIMFEDQVHSYLQVDQTSNRVAWAMQMHARSTVALLLGNGPALVWTWLGLFKLGCSVSMLNTNIRTRSLLHCFNCCGASVLIAGAEQREAVCEVLPELLAKGVCVYVLGDAGGVEGLHNLTEIIEQSPNTPVPHTFRDNVTMSSPGFYIYTSGTTGLPKAGICPQDKIWGPTFFLYLVGVRSDDVIYLPLPLYHGAGLLIGLAGAIERGITVVLSRKFSVSQFWKDCRKYDVTVIQYIGEILRYLCNTPKTDIDRQHKVRLAIGNGLRADVWQEFQRRFGSVDIKEFYAASDGILSFINYVGKIGAVGRVNLYQRKVFPHALIQFDTEKEEPVRDREGHCVPVPTGETGLLVVKITKLAPFVGYVGNPEQTEKKKLWDVFQQGDVYFNSGDLLRMDHDHFLYFQDRVGDTFRWKGENVATSEVSDVVSMLEFIKDANVYGVKVPGHEGRIGMAAVTLKDGQEFECREAFIHISNFLPVYARPRFIRILECMEHTGTFKQVKVTLVEEGFNPEVISQPLYVLQESSRSYVPLTHSYYRAIIGGQIRL